MRAIRAWHVSMTQYGKMFQEIANISAKEYLTLKKSFGDTRGSAFDCTDRLTSLRENLSAAGYKETVEKTDNRFLAEHRGFKSEEEWETFWTDFCARHNIDSRKDAL